VADQLSIYNGALLIIGERFLASLTEEREPRRLLDFVWSDNGVKECLEAGQWNFAMRSSQIDYDPTIDPDFGYNRAFSKPDDWILTSAVCADEFFRSPLTRYVDEAGFWYSDLDTIFVRYVSSDISYGMNVGLWPESFTKYVQAHFASRIILRMSNSETEHARVLKLKEKQLLEARNRSAMMGPTAFSARGNWSLSRNRFPNRRDGGGTTGNLIG
jgi:hypothetical protein